MALRAVVGFGGAEAPPYKHPMLALRAGLAYIARTMKAFDPEEERRRLAQLYAGMADGELEELAGKQVR